MQNFLVYNKIVSLWKNINMERFHKKLWFFQREARQQYLSKSLQLEESTELVNLRINVLGTRVAVSCGMPGSKPDSIAVWDAEADVVSVCWPFLPKFSKKKNNYAIRLIDLLIFQNLLLWVVKKQKIKFREVGLFIH